MRWIIAATVLLMAIASDARAETLVWRQPSGYAEQPMQLPVGTGRLFAGIAPDAQGVIHNYAYAEVPRAGNFIGRTIEQSARGIMEQNGQRSCAGFEILDSSNVTIGGRNAAVVTRRCDSPAGVPPGYVGYRRVLVIEGVRSVFMLQADAFAPVGSDVDAAAALAYAEPLFESAQYCQEAPCAPQ